MQPLLAALDLGSLFAIAFLLISFIGWIMNLINSQNPPPQPNRPARQPQQRDPRVQTEIEDFLQQAMGRGSQQAQEGTGDIEIIEPRQTRRRPPSRRPPPQAATGRSAQSLPRESEAAPTGRPGEGISSRQSVVSSDLGQGVQSHLQEHMSLRVEQHLPHAVEESIGRHLGQFRADDIDTRQGVAPTIRSRAAVQGVDRLIADLRKRGGMRRAIILQEILSKPRALRKG